MKTLTIYSNTFENCLRKLQKARYNNMWEQHAELTGLILGQIVMKKNMEDIEFYAKSILNFVNKTKSFTGIEGIVLTILSELKLKSKKQNYKKIILSLRDITSKFPIDEIKPSEKFSIFVMNTSDLNNLNLSSYSENCKINLFNKDFFDKNILINDLKESQNNIGLTDILKNQSGIPSIKKDNYNTFPLDLSGISVFKENISNLKDSLLNPNNTLSVNDIKSKNGIYSANCEQIKGITTIFGILVGTLAGVVLKDTAKGASIGGAAGGALGQIICGTVTSKDVLEVNPTPTVNNTDNSSKDNKTDAEKKADDDKVAADKKKAEDKATTDKKNEEDKKKKEEDDNTGVCDPDDQQSKGYPQPENDGGDASDRKGGRSTNKYTRLQNALLNIVTAGNPGLLSDSNGVKTPLNSSILKIYDIYKNPGILGNGDLGLSIKLDSEIIKIINNPVINPTR